MKKHALGDHKQGWLIVGKYNQIIHTLTLKLKNTLKKNKMLSGVCKMINELKKFTRTWVDASFLGSLFWKSPPP